MRNDWPVLDYLSWRDTASALHLYLQIVGKYRLARTPWINHSWHATFYVTPRGWTTGTIPDGGGIEILFDLTAHKLVGWNGDGGTAEIPLGPTTVAAFHAAFVDLVTRLGGNPKFHGRPNEVPNPVPFREDERERPYDPNAVERFFKATVQVDRVFKAFRTAFLGKASPVHLFWGSFDLAVTRFSGRTAPPHGGGVPALPDNVAQEAYDHEVSSAGFWPGGGGLDFPAFYAYAYPAPKSFDSAPVKPDAAYWSRELSEFILPYDAVQQAADPDAALLAFLQSTYDAAADLGGWERSSLECAPGAPGVVRPATPSVPAAAPARAAEIPTLAVERLDEGAKGRYRAEVEGSVAEMTFTRAGDHLTIIDHTEVPDALRGRRVGEALVQEAVADARRTRIAILPLCPFAKAQFARHPEWQDVLRR